MTTGTPIELPTGYYLDNFRRLLDTVVARYDDLLNDADADFIHRFDRLDLDAARLLVRLYTRKGPYFRLDKLNYPEIGDPLPVVRRLCDQGLVDTAPELTAGEIARLLTLPELRRLDWVPDPRRSKSELLAELDTLTETGAPGTWGVPQTILAPCHWLTLRRLHLMYFGNEYQSLTDFVLSDLGLFQYESYSLDRSRRWFNDRLEIEQQLHLNDLKTTFYEAEEAGDSRQLDALADRLLSGDWCDAVAERHARLCNRLGFRLEQLGAFDRALALFETNDRPPARERRCRIHYKQGRFETAWDVLAALIDAPQDASEARFTTRFQPRLARKLKRPVASSPAAPLAEHSVVWSRDAGSVEQVACARLAHAVWLENCLPLGVFGLIHWHWIFAEVPGAFHHPFQQGPADLYQADFLERRGIDRQTLYRDLDREAARRRLERGWDEKFGRLNPFVRWDLLDRDLVLRCFDALPWNHWVAIFRHLWLDLRRHRAGFPDLFQFTGDGYRFIEIKGPGDRLQDNQRDWLAVFATHGIPAEVWYVQWET